MNAYYLKALDNYPWDLEQVIEQLGYALSYEEYHAPSHCLSGRLNMDFLKDWNAARHHFEMALVSDKNYVDTYIFYTHFLITQNDFKKAQVIIHKGMQIKGANKAVLIQRQARIFEKQEKYVLAKNQIEVAFQFSFSDCQTNFLNGELNRIKTKLKAKQKKLKNL